MNTNLNKTNHRHSEFISESIRHCEQSEAISSRLPRPNGLAMTNETGRSMVEMLGVLAVIGVLSITGISGYNTAMNKHRANEILDAASKRAVAVSTQIQRGNTSPTLGEFETDTVQNVKFGTPSTVGEKQFRLPLDWTAISDNNQKETLCQYMKQYISEDGENASAQIDEDCTRIVYNNDLSVGTSSDNNTNYDSSTQKCKTGYYGDDCASKCSYTHQVANDDNDGCECATGYTGDTCSTCATNYIEKGSACVACPGGSTTSGDSTKAVPNYDGCYCASGYAWDTSANDGEGGCVSSEPTGSECSGTTCTIASGGTGTAKCNNGYCECTAGVWVPTSTTSSSTGTCVLTETPTSGCYTNNDCKNKTLNDDSNCGTDGCYCNYNGNVNSTNGPTGAGICVQKTTDYHATITISGHKYVASYYNSDYFDWWSAQNFCAAYGKHMMSLSDLGCASGTNCMSSDTLFKQLNTALTTSGKDTISSWTTTLYSSSIAYSVGNGGNVDDFYRNDGAYDVFCR